MASSAEISPLPTHISRDVKEPLRSAPINDHLTSMVTPICAVGGVKVNINAHHNFSPHRMKLLSYVYKTYKHCIDVAMGEPLIAPTMGGPVRRTIPLTSMVTSSVLSKY